MLETWLSYPVFAIYVDFCLKLFMGFKTFFHCLHRKRVSINFFMFSHFLLNSVLFSFFSRDSSENGFVQHPLCCPHFLLVVHKTSSTLLPVSGRRGCGVGGGLLPIPAHYH